MKKIIAMLLALVMVLSLAACGGSNATEPTKAPEAPATPATPETPAEPENPLAGSYDITMWVSESDGMTALTQEMIDAFEVAYPGIVINASIEGVSEADAGAKVIADVASAPDIYCFAQDQLARLVQAAALAGPAGDVAELIKAQNDAGSVAAGSVAGTLYAYPMTSDNGYYMYYDTSIISEEDAESLEAIIAACEANNITNTWYLPAFYFANGGTMFGDGTKGAEGIKFGGDNGAAVTTYLANAIASGNLVDADGNGSGLDDLRNGKVGAYFSGTWDATAVKEALGDNFAAAQLPCITINGESKQLQSFAGSKALGVNPHSKHLKAAYQLAAFMGSAEAQELHYNMRNGDVVPCNTTLLKGETFSKNVAAVAQEATFSNTSVIQPSIPEMSAYWTNAGSMGTGLVNKEVTAANAAEKTEAWNTAINNAGV